MPSADQPTQEGQSKPPAPPTNMINQHVFNSGVKVHSITAKVLDAVKPLAQSVPPDQKG